MLLGARAGGGPLSSRTVIEARGTHASQGSRPVQQARPARTEGGGGFWPEEGDRRRGKAGPPLPRNPLIIAAVAVVALLIAGGAGFFVFGGGDEDKAPAGNGPQLLPTAYTPQIGDKDMARLAQRTVDKRPVTRGEAFPADVKTVGYQRYSFTLAGTDLRDDCRSVTWGARLQADLAKYQCSQVVRGAYVSRDRGYVGQFIAVNLVSQEGAEQIVRDLDPQVNAGFVYPLNPEGAPPFATGFSAAYAQTYGHYAIVTWVQRAGGGQPSSMNELIDISLAVEKPADFVWGRLELVAGTPR
jgi:hypothetical protein